MIYRVVLTYYPLYKLNYRGNKVYKKNMHPGFIRVCHYEWEALEVFNKMVKYEKKDFYEGQEYTLKKFVYIEIYEYGKGAEMIKLFDEGNYKN